MCRRFFLHKTARLLMDAREGGRGLFFFTLRVSQNHTRSKGNKTACAHHLKKISDICPIVFNPVLLCILSFTQGFVCVTCLGEK